MDHNYAYNDQRRSDARNPRVLHHQVSNISELTIDSTRPQDGSVYHVRGRPSLVSLPSMSSLQSNKHEQPPPIPPLPPAASLQSQSTHYQQSLSSAQYMGQPGYTHAQNLAQSQHQTQPQAAHSSQDHSNTPSHSYSGWAASIPFVGYVGGGSRGVYEPITDPSRPPPVPVQKSRRTSRHGIPLRRPSATIHEEDSQGIDLATMSQKSSTRGRSANPYIQVSSNDPEPLSPPGQEPIPMDLSTASGFPPWANFQGGPMATGTLQQQEASGLLTGGLGAGFRSDATIREVDLLQAASPTTPSRSTLPFSRRFSSRMTLGRQNTVKLAQQEADRRGEIIEVIMETDRPPARSKHADTDLSDFDLSDMGGPPSAADKADFGMRRSTFPLKEQKEQQTKVFYPQPNWKPVVMRWPYLLVLIVLAMVLGILMEVAYQRSAAEPLLQFKSPNEIAPGMYFAVKFVPTLLSVSYGVLWQMVDFEVRRLEAFYQLSKEEGALADESINVDYITYFSFFRPFRALRCRHYAVFFSSAASLLAGALVPTLGAASIVLNPDRQMRLANPLETKYITIHPVWSRFLTTILFVIAFLGCVLMWQLQSRRSGLLSDVKGIAGLASMAVVSHILMDFKDMDTATHQDIHHQLRDHRYVLRNSSLAPEDSSVSSKRLPRRPTLRDKLTKVGGSSSTGLSQNPHPLMLRAAGAVPLVVGILLFLILVMLVLFTDATLLADRAPWVVTMLAVCIKMGWGGLETDLRMMEPYYILWRRHAPARTLTLDYTAMPVGWVAIQGLLNRHFLIFAVGFGTVMGEVLIVLTTSLAAVSGRDFLSLAGRPPEGGDKVWDGADLLGAGQETQLSFWFTLGLVSFILLYMAAVATAVVVLRGKPFLPRQPNTIASVLAFIHQSKMIYDFVGTSKLNSKAMARRLAQVGKTYGVGWFEGRDGLTHCGVDEEELLSRYRPGHDYSKTTRPRVEGQR